VCTGDPFAAFTSRFIAVFTGLFPKMALQKIAPMRDAWLAKVAFDNYWRVLETHCPGVVEAPDFSRMSLVEREAWMEAAKAVGEQVRDSVCVASSK
jgi:hypothetical protein